MSKRKVKTKTSGKVNVLAENTETVETDENTEVIETTLETQADEVTESDEVLEVVKTKPTKKDKDQKDAKKDKGSKKKAKNSKPRRNFVKEIFSELKKVNWPTFKQALKQTGAVLVVVVVFMAVVLGIDVLLAWLMSLIVG